ncbi:ribonuclease HII [Christensenellaceae bacterium OttesenSCG-928-L17]|nr:ribonuclease HII [Christensenellaceae bacterium OttesenSCG-928-L17]
MGKRKPEAERLHEITEIERTFWSQPGVVLAGMDEVGRGPLAGPVVAACVLLPSEPLILYVNDSKKVSPNRREAIYQEIKELSGSYALGWIEPEVIDEINILQATKQAFCQAYTGMQTAVTDVLVDAIKNLDIPVRQHSYIHGDARSYLIAAASIVAKVERDRYMVELDAVHPVYGFARNKGYGTAEHIRALKEHGPCPAHRKSFLRGILGE